MAYNARTGQWELDTITVDDPYTKLNPTKPTFGFVDAYNIGSSYIPGTAANKAGVSSWQGTKQLAGQLFKSPVVGMGLGGLVGGFNAYHQAREERNAIKTQNKQLRSAITGLENSKSNLINRTTGATGTLLNQYAMSNDPNKAQGYSGMYGGQLSGMHQGIDSADKSIAGLRTQIQSLPTKDSMWSSALTGALGGISGVGNMFAQNAQRKYYQNEYNKLG